MAKIKYQKFIAKISCLGSALISFNNSWLDNASFSVVSKLKSIVPIYLLIRRVSAKINIENATRVIDITPSIGRNNLPIPLGRDNIKSSNAFALSYSKIYTLFDIRIVFFAI